MEKPFFQNMAGQATMQLELEAEQGILAYQWHMIQDNQVPGLLPLSCYEEGGNVRLCWRVTALQPLSLLLERKVWRVDELMRMIRQLFVLLERMDGLLLDAERLLLDSRYILINPVQLTLGFAYAPLLESESMTNPIRALLLRWLTQECRLKGDDPGGKLSSLLLALNDPAFHWSQLASLLSCHCEAIAGPAGASERAHACLPCEMDPPLHEKPLFEAMPDRSRAHASANRNGKAAENPYARVRESQEDAPRSWARIAAVQVLLVGLAGLCLAGGVLTEVGPDGNMARLGLLILCCAMEAWAFLGGGRGKKEEKKEPMRCPSAALRATEAASANPFSYPVVQEDKTVPDFVEPIRACDAGTERLAVPHGPRLIHHLSDGEERCLELSRSPFLLGRLQSQVDGWLEHPAVGKMHAEIRLETGGPCLVDLNSRNGTRVNGTALVPYVPIRLNAGDHIRIAGEELEFLQA